MGSSSSKLVKKIIDPFGDSEDKECTETQIVKTPNSSYLITSRRGSMFFDEDGDLAHEFYVETMPTKKGTKATMKKILDNLIPQGEVPLKYPRLHVDFPYVLYQI